MPVAGGIDDIWMRRPDWRLLRIDLFSRLTLEDGEVDTRSVIREVLAFSRSTVYSHLLVFHSHLQQVPDFLKSKPID